MLKPTVTGFVVVAVVAGLYFGRGGNPAAPVDPVDDRTQVDSALLRMPRVLWVTTSFVTEDEVVVNVLSLPSTRQCPPLAAPAGGGAPAQVAAIPPPSLLSLCEWAQFVEPKKPTTETLNTLVPFINGVALKALDGTRYVGNQANSGSVTLDSANNVEMVDVLSAKSGQWRIDIVGSNVPQGPQAFALVIVGRLV